LLPINITHISDIEKSINLFEEKNKKCEEVIVGTQKNVVVMKTQVEDTF
jgi:hypothetical protein